MKYVTILIDGAADFEIEKLGNKTPLEYAHKPNINKLSEKSLLGIVKTIPHGMTPGSDVANLSVLGYLPEKYHTGRSPLEAASIGIKQNDTDITFRTNFVTVSKEPDYDEKIMIDHSAGNITTHESAILMDSIKEAFDDNIYSFYPGISYRNLLLMKNGSRDIDITPPHDFLEKKIKDYIPTGDLADKIMSFHRMSHEILKNHPINLRREAEGENPANSLWIWGEGTKPTLGNFYELYDKKAALISAVDLIKGIGILAGMHSEDIEGATGGLDTNFIGKAEGTIKLLSEGYDFVFLHLEAADEASHQGNLNEKIEAIEIIDKIVVKRIFEYLESIDDSYRIIIMPDHYTPISLRTHTSNDVPFMLYDSTKEIKGSIYCERECKKTGCRLNNGKELINLLFN